MIKVTMPQAAFKEIEQRDAVFYCRFDKTVSEDMVECTEMCVMCEDKPTYSKLVSALITGRYDYDSQIAILANKDDGVEEHEAAWTAFQTWRTESKRLARVVFPVSGEEETESEEGNDE